MELTEKLKSIQQKLKVQKGNYNEFGNYNYRSAEDIEHAVKPLLDETNTLLILTDEIREVGEWHYVTAHAILMDIETDKKIEVTASAREQETKKGMDSSQITGSASSYARKYALGGMFLLDNTKDADSMNNNVDDEKEIITEYMDVRRKLEKVGVNTHEGAYQTYVQEKSDVQNIDPSVMTTDEFKKVIKVMKAVLKTKKKDETLDIESDKETF